MPTVIAEFDATGEGVETFTLQPVAYVYTQVTTRAGQAEQFSTETPNRIARMGWFVQTATLDVSGGGDVVFAGWPYYWIDFDAQAFAVDVERQYCDSITYFIGGGGTVHFWVVSP